MAPPSSARPMRGGPNPVPAPKSGPNSNRVVADRAHVTKAAQSAKNRIGAKTTPIKQEKNMTVNNNADAQYTPIRGRSSTDTLSQQQTQQAQTSPLFASSVNPSRYFNQMISNDFSVDDDFEDDILLSNFHSQRKTPVLMPTNICGPGAPVTISYASSSCIGENSSPFINNEARQLKSLISPSNIPEISKDKGGRRRQVEQDPENYEIKRLRVEERLSWSAIAQILNNERIKHGSQPTHTDASVYSRFVRNGPRIAQVQNQTLNPKDFMHMKNEVPARASKISKMKWTPQDETFLVQAFAEVKGDFWEYVSEYLEEKAGKKFSAEECAERYVMI